MRLTSQRLFITIMFKIKTLQHTYLASLSRTKNLILVASALAFSIPTYADVLAVPDDSNADNSVKMSTSDLPRRGISKSQVEAEYGAPKLKHPAIGDPPITRWDYEGFSVFFEFQHVLHSVIPEKPKPIYNKEELHTGY